MRSASLIFLGLAVCLGLAAGARADSRAANGPDPDWTQRQQLEWQLGFVAQAANACGTYDESAVLVQIARMSPYGAMGLDAGPRAALAGPDCKRFIDEAKKLVADAYRIREAIEARYHCTGKACYGQVLAAWPRHSCAERLKTYLAEHAVEEFDVREVTITDVRHSGATLDFTARVRFRSCQGSLYVDMRENCSVERDYTLGDCVVAGVSAY